MSKMIGNAAAYLTSAAMKDGGPVTTSLPILRMPSFLLAPACPQCGEDIHLVRIEPAAPAHDLRTFECAGCGYSKEIDFQFGKN